MTRHGTEHSRHDDKHNAQAEPTQSSLKAAILRCLFCGNPEQLIWVHGHGQCAHCDVNAMPCCDGAVCEID